MSSEQQGRWKGGERPAPSSSPSPPEPDAGASEGGGSSFSTLKAPTPPRSGNDSPLAREGGDTPIRPSAGEERRASSENRRGDKRHHVEADRQPVPEPSPGGSDLLQTITRRFAREWKRGREPQIEEVADSYPQAA